MKHRIIAVLPAYNAAHTLRAFVRAIPAGIFDELILVDDCSQDGTYEQAKKIQGVRVYQTPRNMGYGGNLKRCFLIALEHGADVIVELHPDGEYGFDGIRPALSAVDAGALLVLGNRFTHGRPVGMVPIKYIVSRILSFFSANALGIRIPDMHQGFRVYTRALLDRIPWKDFHNDFLFSFEVIVAARHLPIATVPVTAQYKGKKRGATWGNTIRYVLGMVGAFTPVRRRARIPCPLCHTDIYVQQTYTWRTFAVFFCSGCEIGSTAPQPHDMRPYYPSRLSLLKHRFLPSVPKRQMQWFTRYVSRGDVLDVGSGDGRFAKSLPQEYRVTTLDPYNPHADLSSFKRGRLLKQPFDAIVFWESLEHMPDPLQALGMAYKLLKPGGYLFIEYPRYESLGRRVFGRYWLHFDIPRHLFHCTSRGLARLVAKQGFRVRVNRPVFAPEYGARVGLCIASKPGRMGDRP